MINRIFVRLKPNEKEKKFVNKHKQKKKIKLQYININYLTI